MAETTYGVTEIKMGDVDTPITNPFEFENFPDDSVVVNFPEDDETIINVDDSPSPYLIASQPGVKTFEFGTRDMTPENFELVFGGTLTGASVSYTDTTLAFVDNGAAADTITDSAAQFVVEGFAIGDKISVAGSVSNDGIYTIATVAAGTLTLSDGDKVSDEAAGASITIETADQTWNSPTGVQTITKSVRFTAADDGSGFKKIFEAQNVQVKATLAAAMNNTDTGIISVVCNVLEPASGSDVTMTKVAV